MAHKVLYRVYRPRTFDDVFGQRHITDILKRQIETGSIAHAYLFSGPRGTGKTSTAKIFASALNCTALEGGNPCLKCDNCLDAIEDRSVDIIEMDAASNNGVDNIRDIREKVALRPTRGRYKVYIIDEVHMLSTGAFNALLKTLEEPPSHAVFILATTELRKVPATIASRCQRYEFHRIDKKDIVDRLKAVAAGSSIEYDPGALELIASGADGAMRDAVSMLDMCSSYGRVTEDTVRQALGISSGDSISNLCSDMIAGDVKGSLADLGAVFAEGSQSDNVLRDVICGLTGMLYDAAKDRERLRRILYCLDVVIKASETFRYSVAPKEHLTAVIARACLPECADDPADLQLKVDTLSAKLEKAYTRINEIQEYLKGSRPAPAAAAAEAKEPAEEPAGNKEEECDREAMLIDALHRK